MIVPQRLAPQVLCSKSRSQSGRFFLCLVLLVSTYEFSMTEALADADDLERSVALMAKIGASWSPSFSPDGKHVAFVSNLNGIPQVWTMRTEGGFPTLVTAFDDPVGFVRWSPDGKWLAFNVAPGGGFNEQIYIAHPDGSELRRLTEGGKENNFLGDWTYDGGALYFSSNRRTGASTDSYLVDITNGQTRMVAENRGVGGIQDVSRDGKYAIVRRLINRGDNNLYLINLMDGKEALLTPHDGPGTFLSGKFAPDGRAVYFSSNKDRDLIAFARVKLDARGQPGPIEVLGAREDAELSELSINDQGTMIALVWNVGGRSELSFYDLSRHELTPGPKLSGEIVGGLNFSKDGRRLSMVLSGSADAAGPLGARYEYQTIHGVDAKPACRC